jgi:hypothetical protein
MAVVAMMGRPPVVEQADDKAIQQQDGLALESDQDEQAVVARMIFFDEYLELQTKVAVVGQNRLLVEEWHRRRL